MIPPALAKHWTKLAVLATLLAVVIDAVYLYGVKFPNAVHADAAVPVLMGAKNLQAKTPILGDWYYANGDVWVFGPNWYGAVAVAIGGIGSGPLLASLVFGFLLEAAVLFWAYRRLEGNTVAGVLAACVTLIAWSRMHVLFVYIEPSYGFVATLYIALFTVFAMIAARLARGEDARRFAIAGAVIVFTATLQNPSRALLFALGPLLFACAWPWRGIALAMRARLAGIAVAGAAGATVIYRVVFLPKLTFSIPSGHNAYRIKDLAGILDNVRMLAKGVVLLCGGREDAYALATLALIVLALAFVLVVRELFGSRELTPTRFACVAAMSQLGAVLLPTLLGNLVINPPSARYLMPSFLLVLGLAALLAFRTLAAPGRFALVSRAFVALVPGAAAISLVSIVGSYRLEAADTGQWAHGEAHGMLARELRARGLRHGFATYWNANLVTLLSEGAAKTCSVNFGVYVVPYKWNTDTTCFERLPDRVFIAATTAERADAARAIRASMPPPIERFDVGDQFSVEVFPNTGAPFAWLSLPLPEGNQLHFPLRLPSTHLQLGRMKAIVEGESLVATGEEGVIAFGPYIELPAGTFGIRWVGTAITSPGEIGFDVVGGGTVLAEKTRKMTELEGLRDTDLVRFELTLPAATRAFEARVFSRGGGQVALDELVIERR